MSSWLRHNRGFIAFVLFFGLFRTAVADWNPIPSGSMRPNLLEGDVVFVNRLAYNVKLPLTNVVLARTGEPRRGDIVTFYSPADGARLIKRIVALPGDTVQMRDKCVIVNGVAAQYAPIGSAREHLADGRDVDAQRFDETAGGPVHIVQWLSAPGALPQDNFGPVVVPADRFVMLGDNRDNSADSRAFGFVPRERLIGRAVAIIASADITTNWMPRFARFGEKLD